MRTLLIAAALAQALDYSAVQWGPSRQQTKRGIPQNHGFAALKKELDRSLREKWFKGRRPQTAAGATELLREVLGSRVRDQLILIRGGRLFTTHNFTHNTKHTYMLRLLAAVQRAGGPLPDAWLLYESSSRGKCHDLDGLGGHGRLLPTLVIAKLDGYGQCGILVPNPYFGLGDVNDMWRLQIEDLMDANKTTKKRDPRVFWRGEVANHPVGKRKGYPCKSERGNHARLAALALTADDPSHFDVKCNVGCEARDATKWPCPGLAYDATMRKIYADNSSIRDPKFYTEPDYANYKYVLNLPGKTDGSYSRNLNHLWYVGAAVLLWDTPSVEWYYPALKHGATHAAVNRTTARAVVEALDASPDKYARLLAGARRVQKELTSPEAIARYVRHVVDALRRAQAQHLIKWGAVLAGENCSDFVEVTVDGAPAHAHHLWFYQNASDVANTSARVGMHYTSNVYAPVASCAAMVGAAVKTRDTSSHGASGRTDKPEAVGARVGAAASTSIGAAASASSSSPAQAARSFASMYAPKSSSATAPDSSSSCDRWPRPYHCMTGS